MKNQQKIQLQDVKVCNLSKDGLRKHSTKKKKRPYENTKIKRKNMDKNPNPFYRKVLVQCFVCLTICISVLAISSVDIPVFNDATRGIEFLLEHESSINESWSVFKGLSETVPTLAENNASFIKPTTGEIVSALKDETNQRVGDIYSAPDSKCYASCDGVVFYVDKINSSSPYVRIRHESGFDSLYMGVIPSVETGDTVEQGQIIGQSVGDNVGFVLLKDSEYVNSSEYIDSTK